jgi:hypothetical protein
MKPVVGVFMTQEEARRAAGELESAGIPREKLNLLFPGASENDLASVPTSEMEQPGIGKAVGGVLGGALGAAAGMELGAVVATAVVPGVGPVMAIGLAAAALLGAGGAVGGVAAGKAVDESATEGLPADELFFYEDALRRGRSVLIALAETDSQADVARQIVMKNGAESLDAARDTWWIGLRSAEEEHYRARGGAFEQIEPVYRRGFEAALLRETRGKPFNEAASYLRDRYPEVWNAEAFRAGYERGRAFIERSGRPAA